MDSEEISDVEDEGRINDMNIEKMSSVENITTNILESEEVSRCEDIELKTFEKKPTVINAKRGRSCQSLDNCSILGEEEIIYLSI